MPAATDFRTRAFSVQNVQASAKHVGSNPYWRLYSIENIYRVIVHSILTSQIGVGWWQIAANQNIQNKATGYKAKYTNRPWHSQQGSHDIYYIDLTDLNEIVRANRAQFDPIITDLDQWLLKVESIRLPRNVVAHMNFPGLTDKRRVETVHSDFIQLVRHLQSTSAFPFLIPA